MNFLHNMYYDDIRYAIIFICQGRAVLMYDIYQF